jgi:hypothetical protein
MLKESLLLLLTFLGIFLAAAASGGGRFMVVPLLGVLVFSFLSAFAWLIDHGAGAWHGMAGTLHGLTRDWKREHQAALIGAIVLGCLIGFVFGLAQIDYVVRRWNNALWEISAFDFLGRNLMFFYGTLFWTAFCGVVGGAVVYITQLLRK